VKKKAAVIQRSGEPAMGDLLAVTAQAARVIEAPVIEEGASDDTWRKAALAA